MPFPILAGKAIVDTGFNVDNSCRFNAADSPYFSKDATGDGNQRTFTISVWLKMDIMASGASHFLFDTGTSTNRFGFYFSDPGTLQVRGKVSNTNVLVLSTTNIYRDPAAWFHVYLAIDTTQAVAANRAKLYINGTQVVDSLSTATYPDQNTDFENQDASEPFEIGIDNSHDSASYFDGYMAEYMYVDGAVQAIGDFGEFDEDSPTIWKPKDISAIDVNPGAAQASNGNGFYLDFKASGNLGNDVGNNAGTDFDENNIAATDQTTDTPTNNFCTMNPLDNYYQSATFSEGNTTLLTGSSNTSFNTSTIMPSTGKWYAECKVITGGATANIGVIGQMATATTGEIKAKEFGYAYVSNGEFGSNGSAGSYGDSYTDDDIIGIALDCTNNRLYFSKNGTFQDSGDPAAGSGGKTITAPASTTMGQYSFSCSDTSTSDTRTFSWNFGNPSYANSSDAADADGYGAFEYAPPSGYYALCTKNLAEYG